MARFYNGQPVVCVRGLDFWLRNNAQVVAGHMIPKLGNKYVVGEYHVALLNYMNLCGLCTDHWYSEEGFAPITEDQVRGIIEEATRIPSSRVREEVK